HAEDRRTLRDGRDLCTRANRIRNGRKEPGQLCDPDDQGQQRSQLHPRSHARDPETWHREALAHVEFHTAIRHPRVPRRTPDKLPHHTKNESRELQRTRSHPALRECFLGFIVRGKYPNSRCTFFCPRGCCSSTSSGSYTATSPACRPSSLLCTR